MSQYPETAEILRVTNSPGELDEIVLDLLVKFESGPVVYRNVRPSNYARKPYTCVGPTPGKDLATILWRDSVPVFNAPWEPEVETCGDSPGGLAAMQRLAVPPRQAIVGQGTISSAESSSPSPGEPS